MSRNLPAGNLRRVGRVNTAFSSFKIRIDRLSQIAGDLREGKSFPVTRLTTMKSL
ncbi:MAG: hypothetical protein V1792_21935 [Pseudomonadota bacterium]